MQKELEINNPFEVTVQMVADSFIASAGSISAHVLYIRGLANKHGCDTNALIREFESKVRTFTEEDIHTLKITMARSHKGNDKAIEETNFSLNTFEDGSYRATFALAIPTHEAVEEFRQLIEQENFIMHFIDKAMQVVMDSDDHISAFKDFAAYLDLYQISKWWMKLDSNKKEEMVKRGESYYMIAITDMH